MFEWLGNEGQELKTHTPGVPNYITTLRDRREKRAAEQSGDQDATQESDTGQNARPFPLNPWFVSESVLSEELRGEIFRRVAVQKQNIREVSVDLGVDMRRIGAVVRLVELERRWRQQVCISLISVLVSGFLCNDAKQNIFFRLVFMTPLTGECFQFLVPDAPAVTPHQQRTQQLKPY